MILQGQYSVRVLKGTLSLYGASLLPSKRYHKVFAPISSALPTLSARIADIESNRDDAVRNDILSIVPKANPKTISASFLQRPCIIAIKSLITGLEDIDRLFVNAQSLWSSSAKTQLDSKGDAIKTKSYTVLYTAAQHSCPLVLSLSAVWSAQIAKLTKLVKDGADSRDTRHPRFLVCGPKGAGKSTFARLLLNSLSSASAVSKHDIKPGFLDLDPGQPEFSPAGILSLSAHSQPVFGPSLTHCSMTDLSKAIHFGFISPRDATSDYTKYTEILENYFRTDMLASVESGLKGVAQDSNDIEINDDNDEDEMEDEIEENDEIDIGSCPHRIQAQMPLIINTSGWVKGDGIRILKRIIEICNPDIIVYIGPSLAHPGQTDLTSDLASVLYDAVGVDQKGRVNSRLKMLQPFSPPDGSDKQLKLASRFVAADLRNAQTMAYFHSTGPDSWDFSRTLTSMKPYVVPYDPLISEGRKRGIHVVEILGSEDCTDMQSDHTLSAINGTIVGISSLTSKEPLQKLSYISLGANSAPLPLVKSPTITSEEIKYMNCFGLGVIRAIDVAAGQFQLLTPASTAAAVRGSIMRGQASLVVLARGRLPLPLYAAWDGARDEVAGVPLPRVPYLTVDAGSEGMSQVAGGQTLRVRRNVMRKNQQRG